MGQIITAAAAKGGSAKTTTCAALAQAALKDGKRVLAIDLDPQANLTWALAADQNRAGAYELITGEAPAPDTIQQTAQGVDVIAGSTDLATLKTRPGSANRLRDALQPIQDNYDIIVIDTPPTAGELQYNALEAANGIIIPLEADTYSLQALYQITDLEKQFQKTNPKLTILGVVLTRCDQRSNLTRYFCDVMEAKGKEVGAPLLSVIHNGIAIKEAAAFQISLFDHAPKSKPAADYLNLYNKVFK